MSTTKTEHIIYESGAEAWFCNNDLGWRILHRNDGPAYKDSYSNQYWYLYGKLHNLNGPAVIERGGYTRWYIDGKKIDCQSQEEFEQYKKLIAFI